MSLLPCSIQYLAYSHKRQESEREILGPGIKRTLEDLELAWYFLSLEIISRSIVDCHQQLRIDSHTTCIKNTRRSSRPIAIFVVVKSTYRRNAKDVMHELVGLRIYSPRQVETWRVEQALLLESQACIYARIAQPGEWVSR